MKNGNAHEPVPSRLILDPAAIRKAALEEAAQVCEELAAKVFHPTQVITDRCAAAIRNKAKQAIPTIYSVPGRAP